MTSYTTRLKAIAYIRISTKDQSHFSIEGQTDLCRQHCERSDWTLNDIFIDDGHSAKSFDRPDWKRLEDFVRNNHKGIGFLVVAKYDRFSRNLSEALTKIETLETKYSIRIISVMEPIGVHRDSPYYFKIRADILSGAQTELLIIRDRTKFGIHVGRKGGRYLNKAPFGYINKRDESDRPIIEVDYEKAEIVRKIFDWFSEGLPLASIRELAKKEGLPNKGNSAIQNILTNSVYAGLIKVGRYYDEDEKIVKGLHEPIIDEGLFWTVQKMFGQKTTRLQLNDTVPLRGALRCHCSKLLTAGNSKGKSKYYWYYKCEVHKENISATKIHGQLNEMLGELSLSEDILEETIYRLEKRISEKNKDIDNKAGQISKELLSINQKIETLQENYLGKVFTTEEYVNLKAKISIRRSELTKSLDKKNPEIDYSKIMELANLPYLFSSATTEQKQGIISWVFKSSLYYQEGCYRTPFIQGIFADKVLTLNEKRLLKIEQPVGKLLEFPVCSPYGSSLEHLISIITSIKAA